MVSRALMIASTAAFFATGFCDPITTEVPASTTEAPKLYEWDDAQDKAVNKCVISAVRVGNTIEVTSYVPLTNFYFRAVPPINPYSEQFATKVLFPGQEFKLFLNYGWILYKVVEFQEQGLQLTYQSSLPVKRPGDTKPHILSGSFLIRFKTPAVSETGLPDHYSLDPIQDKVVNDAVVSAVRYDDNLEVHTGTSSFPAFFDTVPSTYQGYGKPRPKILSPGQEFVLRDPHGSIRYKVMDFQKEGLRIRYDSLFHFPHRGDTAPRIAWGSFVVRFNAPAFPETRAPDPYALDEKEDKRVNTAVLSAVRDGDQLKVESNSTDELFWLDAVSTPANNTGNISAKVIKPGQEFVIPNGHGSVRYKVMDFQADGLLIHFHNRFNLSSYRESTTRAPSGSFVVRFKSPVKPTTN